MNKTVGIVAEYNPFHNGHLALTNFAKSQGFNFCIAVMSGNFVQRCQPAITEKRIRAKAAIACGTDVVIELPLAFATASAQHFAEGAISTLKATGAVDAVCFGSEIGEITPLKEIAEALSGAEYKKHLLSFLQSGITFAKARSLAIGKAIGIQYEAVIESPNNLLAVEYISAIKKLNWSVDVITFKRVSVDHHSQTPVGSFASASYIRTHAGNIANIEKYLPPQTLSIYKEAFEEGLYPSQFGKLETALLSSLRKETPETLKEIPDISEGLENKLYSAIRSSTSLEELYENLKSKRYPLSRVRRLVLTAFLGVKKEYISFAPPYIRLLGAGPGTKELLSKIKKNSSVPFSHSLKSLSGYKGHAAIFANLESAATDQYTLCLPKIQKPGYDFYTPAVFIKE